MQKCTLLGVGVDVGCYSELSGHSTRTQHKADSGVGAPKQIPKAAPISDIYRAQNRKDISSCF